MTTYRDWTVGDTLRLCASVEDFCGTQYQGIYLDEINVDKSPNQCSIGYNTNGGCGLHIDNIGVTFKLVKSSGSTQNNTCSPTTVYKTIGEYRTNNNGVCVTDYRVTEQDRSDYLNSSGSYKVMACITNSGGQDIVSASSRVTDTITISDVSPPPGIYNHTLKIYCRPWPWYGIGGATDYLISKLNDLNGYIANFFTPTTGWEYVKTEFTIEGEDVVMNIRLNKIGSITLVQLTDILLVIMAIIALVGLWYAFTLEDNSPTPTPPESAPVKPSDSSPGVQDANKNAKDNCLTILPANPTCADISSYSTCLDSVHMGLYGTLKSIYANFPDFQVTYDRYLNKYKNLANTCDPNTPGKTPSDIVNEINKTLDDYKNQLKSDFDKLQKKYDEENCFIINPFGGCIISNADKNTAILIVETIVVILIILVIYKIFRWVKG